MKKFFLFALVVLAASAVVLAEDDSVFEYSDATAVDSEDVIEEAQDVLATADRGNSDELTPGEGDDETNDDSSKSDDESEDDEEGDVEEGENAAGEEDSSSSDEEDEEDDEDEDDDDDDDDDTEGEEKSSRHAEKSCGKLHFHKNGRCNVPVCPAGEYRKGGGCAKLPSVATCEAEAQSLRSRNSNDKNVRDKEIGVLRTTLSLLSKLHLNNNLEEGQEEENDEEDRAHEVTPSDMLEILETLSADERKEYESSGHEGVIELLKNLESRLVHDGEAAVREERTLKLHCNNLCRKSVDAYKRSVDSWTTKSNTAKRAVKELEDSLARLDGKYETLKKDLSQQVASHHKNKQERSKERALIDWLQKKIHNLRSISDIQASDVAPIIAGLDQDDESMTAVVSLLRAPHVDLSALDHLLNEMARNLSAEDDKESHKIHRDQRELERVARKVTDLKVRRKTIDDASVKAAAKLKDAAAGLTAHRKQCAYFGAE